ncbi:MAG: UMP kinase [archaeon]
MKTIILSLGGSIIVPEEVDYFFLKEFKAFILRQIAIENRFVIICGGGKTNSRYNAAAQRVSNVSKDDLDWVGIASSKLNAELLRAIFGKLAHKRIITNPTLVIKTTKPVIVAAGWKPGWSTDYDAVLIAEQLKASVVINLTNISHVYDKDPRVNKDAKKLYNISWKEYRKMVGNKWSPRMSSPFDPIASKEAQKAGLKVAILKGTDIKNLENYVEGKEFYGTIIE